MGDISITHLFEGWLIVSLLLSWFYHQAMKDLFYLGFTWSILGEFPFLNSVYQKIILALYKRLSKDGEVIPTAMAFCSGKTFNRCKKAVDVCLMPPIILLFPLLLAHLIIKEHINKKELLRQRLTLRKKILDLELVKERALKKLESMALQLDSSEPSEENPGQLFISTDDLKAFDDISIAKDELRHINSALGIRHDKLIDENLLFDFNISTFLHYRKNTDYSEPNSIEISLEEIEQLILGHVDDSVNNKVDDYSEYDLPRVFRAGGISPSHKNQPSIVDESKEDWQSIFTSKFKKSVKILDKNMQGRIFGAVLEILENPVKPKGDTVKPLSAEKAGLWRYRLGDYRLVYFPKLELHKILFIDIGSRGGIYEN